MTTRTLELCQQLHRDVKEPAIVAEHEHEGLKQKAKKLIAELKLDEIATKKWKYRMPHDIVKINDRMSKDLSLFYTVDDVRKLFNWK